MNNDPTYQQPLCSPCATCDESNTTTTRKQDENETKTTANDTVRCVPQLRFPEFQNAGEWEETIVEDVIKTLTPPKKLQSKEFKTIGKFPIIDQSQVYICGYSDDETAILNKDSQELIIFGDHTCILKLVNFPFIQGADGIKIFKSKNKKRLNTKFLYYILQHFHIEPIAYKRHFSELRNKKILFPSSPKEQQKIASCLLSIDDNISAMAKELESLRTHKKALLQKLFPQHGKTTPELRFPEFQSAGEWESKRLGEIITVNSGRDYKHLKYGDVPVYGTGGYMLSVDDYLSDVDAIGIGRKGTIDKPQYLKAPFWTVDTLFFLTCKEGYNTKYMYYLSQTIPWKKYGEQTGVPSLSKTAIENLEIMIPSNVNEQKGIADVLSTLDRAEELLSNKILLLQQHKEGLMQKLFVRL